MEDCGGRQRGLYSFEDFVWLGGVERGRLVMTWKNP